MTFVQNPRIKTLGRHVPRVVCLSLFGFLLFCIVPRETDAQGTIFFANRVTQPPIFAPVTDSRTGQRLEGAAWLTRLYYAKGPFSESVVLKAADPAVPFRTGTSAGFISPVVVTLPDVEPETLVTVQMRAWNAEAGATYEEAASSPIGVIGQSNRIYLVAGGGDRLPADMVPLSDFSVYPIPEPGPLVLIVAGLLGISLARLSRRR